MHAPVLQVRGCRACSVKSPASYDGLTSTGVDMGLV
jgi:hypothetical protein